MSNYNRRNLKALPPEKRNIISVSEYLRKRDERANLPGRINENGEMLILYNGEWVDADSFAKKFPPIVLPVMGANLNNTDKRNLWQFL